MNKKQEIGHTVLKHKGEILESK